MAVAIDQSVPLAERYIMFLRLFSVLYSVNLSEQELKVLNHFWLEERGLITTESRARVAVKMNVSAFSMNNYLRKLRLRNVVGKTALNEKLLINIQPTNKTLSVVFNLTDDKS